LAVVWTAFGEMPAVDITLWNADLPLNETNPYSVIQNFIPPASDFYQFNWLNISDVLPTGSNYYLIIRGVNSAGQSIVGLSRLFGVRNPSDAGGGKSL
jgi:hypothetical protein